MKMRKNIALMLKKMGMVLALAGVISGSAYAQESAQAGDQTAAESTSGETVIDTTGGFLDLDNSVGDTRNHTNDNAGTAEYEQDPVYVVVPKPVKPKKQTLSVTVSPRRVSYKTLKKRNVSAAIKASGKGNPKITYTKASANAKKWLTVNARGRVTIKKKAPKGTYRITVKAKATKYYKAASKTVTIIVR